MGAVFHCSRHVRVAMRFGRVTACKRWVMCSVAVIAAVGPGWVLWVGAGLAQVAASGRLCWPLVFSNGPVQCLVFVECGSRVDLYFFCHLPGTIASQPMSKKPSRVGPVRISTRSFNVWQRCRAALCLAGLFF